MKNQAILFVLSIHVSIMIAATGCSGPLQSIQSCHAQHAPFNALIREIPWLRHQSTPFENATLARISQQVAEHKVEKCLSLTSCGALFGVFRGQTVLGAPW